jgi:hypothetical protein
MQQCIHVKRVRGRARGRLDGRLQELVRGEALRYQQRPGLHPQLEQLRQRFLAGEPVTLADVFAAAGLVPASGTSSWSACPGRTARCGRTGRSPPTA